MTHNYLKISAAVVVAYLLVKVLQPVMSIIFIVLSIMLLSVIYSSELSSLQ